MNEKQSKVLRNLLDYCERHNIWIDYYDGYTEGGSDNCGAICSDKSICPTGELCDGDDDCTSAFRCNMFDSPPVCY